MQVNCAIHLIVVVISVQHWVNLMTAPDIELETRVKHCGYYELVPDFARDLMVWRTGAVASAKFGEKSLTLCQTIEGKASELEVEVRSITLRDSFLWSPAPDDIDVYVVVTKKDRHQKVFKDLEILIPGLRVFKADIWFVGEHAINDLQKTWMFRRGVTIQGPSFAKLPANSKLYLGFAVAKGLTEAIEFRGQGNYHKMVHRLVAAAYYGILCHDDNLVLQAAHRYLASNMLRIIHSDSGYGDVLRAEYGQAIEQLTTLNGGPDNQFIATAKLIEANTKLAKLDSNGQSVAASLCEMFFELFPNPKTLTGPSTLY